MDQLTRLSRVTVSQSCVKDGQCTVMRPNGGTTATCSLTTLWSLPVSSPAGTFVVSLTGHAAWSGGLKIDDFIETSKKGRANGDFIMHRENGTLAEVNLAQGRGIGKMKATITQRFTIDGIPCDIDADGRFIFFCKMTPQGWKTQWVKLFYEKDKVVPVDGKAVPHFPKSELAKYTEGEMCSQT